MLGERIRALRKERGLSQKQIAIKLKISQGAISQWEHELTEPAADQLLALAAVFGVSPYELKGVDTPTPKKEPAISDGIDGELVNMLVTLSPLQEQRVKDFVAGMLAAETT